MTVVDIIVPALHRTGNPPVLMDSLRRTADGCFRCWFIIEDGDVEERRAVENAGATAVDHGGTFPEKVQFAWEMLQERGDCAPWIMPVGDDVMFHPGWLDAALAAAQEYGWDVVGTNDLLNPRVLSGTHATHPLIRSDYIAKRGASWDGPGTVCHTGYRHCYVDNEWSRVALDRGVFGVALNSVVEHLHPFNNKVLDPSGYDEAYASMHSDAAIYVKREAQFAAMI
jgi:hypothetical protein